MAINSSCNNKKRERRKKLVFEAVFKKETDSFMYEEVDNYLNSIGLYEKLE